MLSIFHGHVMKVWRGLAHLQSKSAGENVIFLQMADSFRQPEQLPKTQVYNLKSYGGGVL